VVVVAVQASSQVSVLETGGPIGIPGSEREMAEMKRKGMDKGKSRVNGAGTLRQT
jgi:hypothetical protein